LPRALATATIRAGHAEAAGARPGRAGRGGQAPGGQAGGRGCEDRDAVRQGGAGGGACP
jgi:hypothetical protein